ncbi:MAG: serine hydrolase domain-containing protein, partial [Stellaceae bacterium]
RYAYTNFGFTEAAVAAAIAFGKSWEEVSDELIYRPWGMKHTSSRFADFTASANRALGHVRLDGSWVARYTRDPDAQSPAGGASSTARDMAMWLRLQLGGGRLGGKEIVAAEPLDETHRPQIVRMPPKNPAVDYAGFYGLGWNINYDAEGRIQWGHSGGFSLGAATSVSLLPDQQVGIVVLTNAQPIGVPEAVSRGFFDVVLTGKVEHDWLALYGQLMATALAPNYGAAIDYSKPPAQPSPALPAAAYAGAYQNDLYGPIMVAATDAGLAVELGPGRQPFPIQHFDRDVFTYQPSGENAAGLSAVSFAVGADQKANAVTIENLDIDGQGTFSRAATAK